MGLDGRSAPGVQLGRLAMLVVFTVALGASASACQTDDATSTRADTLGSSGDDRLGGHIIFENDPSYVNGESRGYDARLFRMSPDGSNVIQLTQDWAVDGRWLPEASRIAFQAGSSLDTMNLDGSDRQPWLRSRAILSGPEWLGGELQFSATWAGAHGHFALGPELRLITPPGKDVVTWALTRDGTSAFALNSYGFSDLSIYRIDEEGRPQFEREFEGDYQFARWSPNGRLIAADLRGTLVLIDVAAGTVTEAIPAGTFDLVLPIWSPDGTALAFSGKARPDDDVTIFIVNSSDGEVRSTGVDGVVADWVPEGAPEQSPESWSEPILEFAVADFESLLSDPPPPTADVSVSANTAMAERDRTVSDAPGEPAATARPAPTVPSPTIPDAPWAGDPVAAPMTLGELPQWWSQAIAPAAGCPLVAPVAAWAATGVTGPPTVHPGGGIGGPFIEWPGDSAPSLFLHEPPLDANDPQLARYYVPQAHVRRFADGSEERLTGDGGMLLLLPGVACAYEFYTPDTRVHAANFFDSLRIIEAAEPGPPAPVVTTPSVVTSSPEAPSSGGCPTSGTEVFERGDGWCADIETLQIWLNKWGYPVGVDGYFGPATEGAVATFQFDNLLVVDGTVGPETWSLLSDAEVWDF